MRAWMLMTLLLTGAADAEQVIWKCRDTKGGVTFQNSPCEPATREVGAKVFYTAPDSEIAADRARMAQAEIDRRNAELHSQSQSYPWINPRPESERDKQRARCNAARATLDRAISQGVDGTVRTGLERVEIDACFEL